MFQVQHRNGGKCGVCGDAWDAIVKPNEAGGRYANGIITGHYQSGASVEVRVEITANHRGHFEFRLCPHNNVNTPVRQECLDQHLLQVETRQGLQTRYRIGSRTGIYNVRVRLPTGVICTQCVLQWTYIAGG